MPRHTLARKGPGSVYGLPEKILLKQQVHCSLLWTMADLFRFFIHWKALYVPLDLQIHCRHTVFCVDYSLLDRVDKTGCTNASDPSKTAQKAWILQTHVYKQISVSADARCVGDHQQSEETNQVSDCRTELTILFMWGLFYNLVIYETHQQSKDWNIFIK